MTIPSVDIPGPIPWIQGGNIEYARGFLAGISEYPNDTLNRADKFKLLASGYDPDDPKFPGFHFPVNNIKAFGGVLNGVADDTGPFNEMLNKSVSNGFPCVIHGTPLLTTTVQLPFGTVLLGTGRKYKSTIKRGHSGSLFDIIGFGVQFRDLSFDLQGSTYTGNYALDYTSSTCDDLYCDACTFINIPSASAAIHWPADKGKGNIFQGCGFTGISSTAVAFKQTGQDTEAIRRIINTCDAAGMYLFDVEGCLSIDIQNSLGAFIKMTSATSFLRMLGGRVGTGGGTTTLKGVQNNFTGISFAGPVVLDSSLDGSVYIGGDEDGLTDNTGPSSSNIIISHNLVRINGIKQSANADTSGLTLGQLEIEVNEVKAILRSLNLLAS